MHRFQGQSLMLAWYCVDLYLLPQTIESCPLDHFMLWLNQFCFMIGEMIQS